VLLKDVFDYSLDEIADLVESTVGGVKAALNRGRTKLAGLREQQVPRRPISPEASRLLHLYVERFNERDWDGLRQLIAADATLRVAIALWDVWPRRRTLRITCGSSPSYGWRSLSSTAGPNS
jgi:RNA polymerase sigma-70 factor, ECF subfamily